MDSPSADDAPAKTKKTKRGFGGKNVVIYKKIEIDLKLNKKIGFMGTVRKYKGKITGEEKEDIEVKTKQNSLFYLIEIIF